MFCTVKTTDNLKAFSLLRQQYPDIRTENGRILVYDENDTERIVDYLYDNGILVGEIKKNKIGLEEYYIDLMNRKEA